MDWHLCTSNLCAQELECQRLTVGGDRYEWELRRGNSTILRRILEQDESPNRLMVLCVAGIKLPKDTHGGPPSSLACGPFNPTSLSVTLPTILNTPKLRALLPKPSTSITWTDNRKLPRIRAARLIMRNLPLHVLGGRPRPACRTTKMQLTFQLLLYGVERSILCPAETQLELMDGWYSMRTAIDPALARLVAEGKLCLGKIPSLHWKASVPALLPV